MPPPSRKNPAGSGPGATGVDGVRAEGADPDMPLVEAIRRGETAAWTQLLTRYQNRIFSLCLRMVSHREMAEDLAQDCMVKLLQGLSSYDGRSRLSTWVYRITMNVCLSKLRSEKYRRHASLDAFGAGAGGGEEEGGGDPGIAQRREQGTHEGVEEREDRGRMLAALAQLDEQQRAILLLRDSRGLDYEQIAEVLDVPVGTVKSRLFRARAALRDLMEKSERLGLGPEDMQDFDR